MKSSIVSVKTQKRVLLRKEFSISGFEQDGTCIVDEVKDSLVYVQSEVYFCRMLGQKQYELSNHLGNVLATVLDRKTGVFDPVEDTLMYYTADVVNATLYYPFGQAMLSYKNVEYTFAYGLNGQEKEDDIFEGAYSAEYWMYDSRLGRRWNVDPRNVTSYSPYSCFANNPIWFVDMNGDSATNTTHTVNKGETLWGVSKDYYNTNKESIGTTWEVYWNNVQEWNVGGDYTQIGGTMHLSNPNASREKTVEEDILNFYDVPSDIQSKISFNNSDYFPVGSNDFPFMVANNNEGWFDRYIEFKKGTGYTNMVYLSDHPFSVGLQNMFTIEMARSYFYNKYSLSNFPSDASMTRYDGKFGITGPLKSINMYQQYVGTSKISVFRSDDGKNLIFVVSNTTGAHSYREHRPWVKDIPRTGGSGGEKQSTILNLYIWTEPIDYSKLKK